MSTYIRKGRKGRKWRRRGGREQTVDILGR
jgi:hypothetical protein